MLSSVFNRPLVSTRHWKKVPSLLLKNRAVIRMEKVSERSPGGEAVLDESFVRASPKPHRSTGLANDACSRKFGVAVRTENLFGVGPIIGRIIGNTTGRASRRGRRCH